MTIYQPASPYSDAIVRPVCSRCEAQTMLSRIEPDKPDHDKRSFECIKCGNEHTEVVKYK